MKMIYDHIIKNNTEAEVMEMIDEAIPDYLDDDWETEFDDISEAYSETGRGEAESQVLRSLIEAGTKEFLVPALTNDQYCDLFDKLAEHWNITTD
jgi:hypothetical protein